MLIIKNASERCICMSSISCRQNTSDSFNIWFLSSSQNYKLNCKNILSNWLKCEILRLLLFSVPIPILVFENLMFPHLKNVKITKIKQVWTLTLYVTLWLHFFLNHPQKNSATITHFLPHLLYKFMNLVTLIFIWYFRALSLEIWLSVG